MVTAGSDRERPPSSSNRRPELPRSSNNKGIPDARDRLDLRGPCRVWLNLAAQTVHQLLEHGTIPPLSRPDSVEQRVGSHHLPSVQHQHFQQARFQGCETHRAQTQAMHFIARTVQAQAASSQFDRQKSRVSAAQNRTRATSWLGLKGLTT